MKIESKPLLEAIKKVNQIVAGEFVQLKLKDNKLRISSSAERAFEYVMDVNAPKETFEFALPVNAVVKNLKGIVEIQVDRQVVISTPSYKAELAFQPYLELEFDRVNANTTVSPDQIYQVETSLGFLALSGIVESTHYAVQMDSTGFKACAFDRVHFGIYSNPTVKSDTPLTMFVNINDMNLLLSAMQSDTEGFTMSIHEGYVQARNSVSRLRMPLLQVTSREGLQQIEGLAKTFGKPTMTIIPADLYDALDRARAVYDVTGQVMLDSEEGKLFVSTVSATGKFKEVIAARTAGPKISVPTDPNLLMDVLARLYKDEQLHMGSTDKFTFFKFKAEDAFVTYGCFAKQGN